MFWQSVLSGLGSLLHWQVWAGALLYAKATECGESLVGAFGVDPHTKEPKPSALLASVSVGPLVRSLLGGVLIVWLFPLMLGQPEATPPGVMLQCAGSIARSAGIAFLVVAALHFVPVVGEVVSRGQISTLILDVVLFRVLSGRLLGTCSGVVGSLPATSPGFRACAGYLAIAIGLLKGIQVATALILARTGVLGHEGRELWAKAFLSTLTLALNFLAGLLPIFMYVRYVAASLRAWPEP